VVPEQRQQDDYRQRHAQQPQQGTSSKTHDRLPFIDLLTNRYSSCKFHCSARVEHTKMRAENPRGGGGTKVNAPHFKHGLLEEPSRGRKPVARGEENEVTSTFLHDDNKIPPDEVVDRDAPHCKACDQKMWVVRVETLLSDAGTVSKRDYECSRCGARQSVRTRSMIIEPSSLASGS
jgi:hypothetical protein